VTALPTYSREATGLVRDVSLLDQALLKSDNPYTPGAGRKPPNLAGRDSDLENFQALTERIATGGYEDRITRPGSAGELSLSGT
jgi:hypothetical protein